MINHDLIKHQDKLYFVYRKFNTNQVKENKIHELMNLLECDIILRKTQQTDELYYLKEIVELEII
jgi:hypothetical protein